MYCVNVNIVNIVNMAGTSEVLRNHIEVGQAVVEQEVSVFASCFGSYYVRSMVPSTCPCGLAIW